MIVHVSPHEHLYMRFPLHLSLGLSYDSDELTVYLFLTQNNKCSFIFRKTGLLLHSVVMLKYFLKISSCPLHLVLSAEPEGSPEHCQVWPKIQDPKNLSDKKLILSLSVGSNN